MSDLITRIRRNLSKVSGSEAKAVATNEDLQELWSSKQQLLAEMNRAKKEAAEQAALPYLELISAVDKQYGFLLQMVGENKDDP